MTWETYPNITKWYDAVSAIPEIKEIQDKWQVLANGFLEKLNIKI